MTNARSPTFALPSGCRIFEFEIETVLGHGGFGITYLALDVLLQERVALKEYLPSEIAIRHTNAVRPKTSELEGDYRIGLSSFLKEARILARFRAPYIVQVRRFFEYNGTGYIVLDYESGLTLAEKLETSAPLPEDELMRLFSQILDALEPLHERGILHRDLKPSNIILRDKRYPVLIDFGSAKDFLARHSRSVAKMVTEGYSPPEQYELGDEQGPWTDFYALGAIAYQCVTGAAPVDSRKRLRDDPMVPASTAGSGRYKKEFLNAVDWMLNVEESSRPYSVEDIRQALLHGRSGVAAHQRNQPGSTLPALDRNDGVSPPGHVSHLDMVIRRSDGQTVLQFGTDIEADVLELSFHSRSRDSYLTVASGGEVIWGADPFFFSLMRAQGGRNDLFLIEPKMAAAVEPGTEVDISSIDEYIQGTVAWPGVSAVDQTRSTTWLVRIAVVSIGLLVLGLAVKYAIFK